VLFGRDLQSSASLQSLFVQLDSSNCCLGGGRESVGVPVEPGDDGMVVAVLVRLLLLAPSSRGLERSRPHFPNSSNRQWAPKSDLQDTYLSSVQREQGRTRTYSSEATETVQSRCFAHVLGLRL
jgi:hypothetical protein